MSRAGVVDPAEIAKLFQFLLNLQRDIRPAVVLMEDNIPHPPIDQFLMLFIDPSLIGSTGNSTSLNAMFDLKEKKKLIIYNGLPIPPDTQHLLL